MLNEIIEESEAKLMQPLVLAQIGDSVHQLFARREFALKYKVKVNKLSKLVSKVVCAGNQFLTFKAIEQTLTADELDIANRARNTHIHSHAKNFSITEYIYATALEALLGYLYLIGKNERFEEIIQKSIEIAEDKLKTEKY